ncbi:MAG TPA: HAD family hydrolase [Candidatus Dependentiae bacterium]|nr:HAD family hydrolase [Candidatus Dependentiae bacterium]
MNRYKIITLLFTIIITPINFYPRSLTKPTTIIFDIPGVLFKENRATLRQKIGIRSLASYAITHWKNPSTVCFDLLETMSKHPAHQPSVLFRVEGKIMPRCIVEWQQGYKTCDQVWTELVNFIKQMAQQNYFRSIQEKNLTQHILKLIFDTQQLPELTKPVMPMIDLAKQLKEAGYQLLLLANVPHELYSTIKNIYPEIIELFDGSIISCQTHILKPDKQMFKKLLDTYQLNPDQCILIDDKEESVAAAQELGIRGITYKKTSLLIQRLKELGIITN